MDQAFPLRFCILQAIKNWTVGRPGNKATFDYDRHCDLGIIYRYSDGEIEQQVVQLRNTLTQEGYKSRPLDPSSAYETHKIAEASEQKERQLKSAFGIREDYQEGSAFDPVQKALLTAQAREEREKQQTE